MSEVKDPKIKLFGTTIELPEAPAVAAADTGGEAAEEDLNQEPPCSSDSMLEDDDVNRDADGEESHENLSVSKQDQTKEDEKQSNRLTSEELKDSSGTQPIIEDSNTPSCADTEVKMLSKSEEDQAMLSKTDEDQNETSNSQEKTLKKPDKILPCPRCNSMDTKFCYFNNYNVNQPRHFCKNCQRYWTAGGTMRNVPVGAGRRKNKNSISQFRYLSVPESLQNGRVDLPNGIHHPVVNSNGTVLTFGSDSPLCESMASALNIVDKTVRNSSRNEFRKPEEVGVSVSDGVKENREDHLSRSSVTNSKDEAGKNVMPEMMSNCHPFPLQVPLQVPCYPGAPWPYPWNPVQWNSAISPPAFRPVPFYSTPPPPPYWGCSIPGSWTVPWVMPRAPAPSHGPTPPSSGPNSPTLGKHSREDSILKQVDTEERTVREGNSEKNHLWVPKTLRIDDPGDAAKSSIWATLGIKNDRSDRIGANGGLFKAFQSQSKGEEKAHVPETSTVLQANPAALSRSLNFHEVS